MVPDLRRVIEDRGFSSMSCGTGNDLLQWQVGIFIPAMSLFRLST